VKRVARVPHHRKIGGLEIVEVPEEQVMVRPARAEGEEVPLVELEVGTPEPDAVVKREDVVHLHRHPSRVRPARNTPRLSQEVRGSDRAPPRAPRDPIPLCDTRPMILAPAARS
jgi:hypothetical protein